MIKVKICPQCHKRTMKRIKLGWECHNCHYKEYGDDNEHLEDIQDTQHAATETATESVSAIENSVDNYLDDSKPIEFQETITTVELDNSNEIKVSEIEDHAFINSVEDKAENEINTNIRADGNVESVISEDSSNQESLAYDESESTIQNDTHEPETYEEDSDSNQSDTSKKEQIVDNEDSSSQENIDTSNSSNSSYLSAQNIFGNGYQSFSYDDEPKENKEVITQNSLSSKDSPVPINNVELGRKYFEEKDYKNAIHYLKPSKDTSDIYKVGYCYFCLNEYDKAYNYLSIINSEESATLLNNIGKVILQNEPNNQSLAYECFVCGANQNHDKCSYNAGYCNEHGLGTAENIVVAAKYYKQSADLGNVIGMCKIGSLYLKRNTPLYNPNMAINYYNKACENNSPLAYYQLGVIYNEGIFVNKDPNKAKELVKASMQLGSKEAHYYYEKYFASNELNDNCALELDDDYEL